MFSDYRSIAEIMSVVERSLYRQLCDDKYNKHVPYFIYSKLLG